MSRPRFTALLLALITLAIYVPVTSHDFVNYDDQDYVTANNVVQNGLTWAGLKWAFTTVVAGNWHPVTMLSHMLDCELFGLNPAAQHFVNVLFHAANTVLLFILLLRLTNSLWPSAFVAALFAWHPLHAESVAWIAERKDVLSTFFELLSLLAYTKYAKGKKRGGFWLAFVFFALGLMSKPMLVTLPFVMLLLDFWPLQRISFPSTLRSKFSIVFEKWPFFLLTAVFCVVTYIAQQRGEALMTLEQLSFDVRFENALIAYGRYLLDTIWPVNLAVLYPLPNHLHWIHAAAATATAALFVISWLAWRARNKCITVGWLWFLGTLVPVIGLVKVGSAALADRYTYFPLIGIFIAVAFGARDLAARFQFLKKFFVPAAILILVACVALTERQLQFWRNSETLFRHALAVTQDNATAHLNLGVALQEKGESEQARAEYEAALKIFPESYAAHDNLGTLLDDMGKPDAALEQFQEALRLKPNDASAHLNLATELVQLGRFAEAMSECTNAIRLNPADPWPHFQIAKALLKQGRDAAAIDQFREALQLEPDNFKILAYTAHVLAANENSRFRDGQAALALAAKANSLTDGGQPFVLDVLGMACAETGDFNNAVDAAQKALDLATALKMKNLEPLQRRLQLYKNHEPWRESFLFTNAPAKN